MASIVGPSVVGNAIPHPERRSQPAVIRLRRPCHPPAQQLPGLRPNRYTGPTTVGTQHERSVRNRKAWQGWPNSPHRLATDYSAKDIEVLEGLEPVRRRPGMYIGGTDETALHHLAAEILDNAMDEAVAGHASFIEVSLERDNWLTVRDNGRGIPVDPHPKFKNLSALEVDSHHAAFGREIRRQGLRDLGRPARRRQFRGQRAVRTRWRSRSRATACCGSRATRAASRPRKLINAGPVHNRRGTTIRFRPDPTDLRPAAVQPGAAVPPVPLQGLPVPRRRNPLGCDPALLKGAKDDTPAEAVLHFPGGLRDSLEDDIGDARRACCRRSGPARRTLRRAEATGRVEWAVAWLEDERRLPALLLQHRAHAAGRHARGRLPRRAAEGPARLGRASRQPPRRAGHRRRRARRRWRPSCRCSCASRSSRARPRRS